VAVRTEKIAANGLTFTCRRDGPEDGDPVLLLHGFPETSRMWLPLIARLADEGYRVLAPDQRGYSPGARPSEESAYAYANLVEDVFALADAIGVDRFHLVGHNHGAGVGWAATAARPERVASYVAMSVPHARAFTQAIAEDDDQQERSQYIIFFRQPGGVAEQAFSANDFEMLRGVWSSSSDDEVADYLEVFRQEGALQGALNWYRNLNEPGQAAGLEIGEITTPTLLIWGNQDNAIGRRGVELGEAYMKGPYRLAELDAGHWLIQEEPARVCDEVVAHLAEHPLG
jgi:pimeloyl-ACP methyl ester carboxylesterase